MSDILTTPPRAVVALPSRHDELSPVERRSRQSVGLKDFLKTLPVPVKRVRPELS
jgi:hypothetical protein